MSLVWFITGVSSGFGFEIMMQALQLGHHAIGTVRNRERARDQVLHIESKGGHVMELDITQPDACFEVWHAALGVYERIDVLCNNAGMSYMGAMEDYTDIEIHAQMNVNVYGPYRLIRAALPHFRDRKSGTVVNISSVSGLDGAVASGLYAMSKFAIEGLSEALASELAAFHVNVLLVEPGAFRTKFLSAYATNNRAHLHVYPTASKTISIFETFDGKQRGDPRKAARIIVEVAGGQGGAGHLKGKILRLPLGPDCVARYEGKIQTMMNDLDMTKSIAVSTDIV